MRKITYKAARAFIEGRNFNSGNTSVRVEQRTPEDSHPNRQLYLHGNLIAEYTNVKGLHVTLATWPTVTTRERLNGLLTELGKREGVWQHKHEQHYGTHEANRIISSSEWIPVT
jgi:hypothetical protein